MPKLSQVKARDLVKVVTKLGFKFRAQSGSHAVYVHPDGRKTTIPKIRQKPSAKDCWQKLLREIYI